MSGFAVIDLKTTGFAYNANDRVCDLRLLVAPALVNAAGRREDSWTTLVSPQRDLGAQHIHRIDALAWFDTERASRQRLPRSRAARPLPRRPYLRSGAASLEGAPVVNLRAHQSSV